MAAHAARTLLSSLADDLPSMAEEAAQQAQEEAAAAAAAAQAEDEMAGEDGAGSATAAAAAVAVATKQGGVGEADGQREAYEWHLGVRVAAAVAGSMARFEASILQQVGGNVGIVLGNPAGAFKSTRKAELGFYM